MRTYTVGIFLYSPMRAELGRRDAYAPTQHPTFTGTGQTIREAATVAKAKATAYAMKNLKLEENKSGNGAFQLRPV